MFATFLALGTAISDETVHRAGKLLRELIADDVVDPETADILESILVGIDSDPDERKPFAWFDAATQPAHAA
jgi:hypothetical protein